ncbi:glycosyltransferase [Hansschlegelia zhihuaiae]|uniref:Glycosyltransferase n=1 Tax=Hansschlegelia zhihuaiae TaxID=405005 RepID=A0A4Q0M5C4_9HYPH|nr:glycosyltransferase [Hansschlegelia zhihuaiae]RXF67939.1 glycosyltransferase [Hansschlegelia zhihuaiae]
MTEAPIGYYVHHHGEGHRRRAMAIAKQAPGRLTLIGTGVAGLQGPFDTLDLPDDRLTGSGFDGEDNACERPDSLHYAPVHHDGVRGRARAVAGWIAERRPALMVVDVSVEIAMLARLCATPTIYVRLAGARWDEAHLDAFRGAQALIAPFDRRCEVYDAPGWVVSKTRYLPGLGAAPASAASRDNVVLVAFGRGGAKTTPEDVTDAAAATPARRWRVIGPMARPLAPPANLDVAGWVDHAEQEIARAGVVVGGAGDGVLSAAAAGGRPFVCVPEDRQFDEQRAKANALKKAGAAVVLPAWPRPAEWPGVLADAEAIDPLRLSSFHDPDGPAKAASFILGQADR